MNIPEAPKDKRTKEYKQWLKNYSQASLGFGDTIEKVTTATGIKKVVKWIAGDDCGCDQRKEKLNKLFSYQKPECLKEDEFNYLKDFYANKTSQIKLPDQLEMLKIYNRIFKDNMATTTCDKCFLNEVYKKLEKVYSQYL